MTPNSEYKTGSRDFRWEFALEIEQSESKGNPEPDKASYLEFHWTLKVNS
jgi:hypothetical protein